MATIFLRIFAGCSFVFSGGSDIKRQLDSSQRLGDHVIAIWCHGKIDWCLTLQWATVVSFHSDLKVVCVVNKHHRCLHKSDAPIRSQNIDHVHRGVNTQSSLCTCKHLIQNMIRTVDKTHNWDTKAHVNAVMDTRPSGDFTQPDTRDLTPLWPGHKRFARGHKQTTRGREKHHEERGSAEAICDVIFDNHNHNVPRAIQFLRQFIG